MVHCSGVVLPLVVMLMVDVGLVDEMLGGLNVGYPGERPLG